MLRLVRFCCAGLYSPELEFARKSARRAKLDLLQIGIKLSRSPFIPALLRGGLGMRCSQCHADNPAAARFCGQCGAPLGSACPSCGAGNPPENRFCGQCGAPLDRPGPPASASPLSKPASSLPGEMKQVTVLFCDIVGSTPLSERLGPEAMRDLVSAFLATSLAEVQRYGGVAPQFTGDGFMALFGAPVTLEDHVQRALLAALAIQRALGGTTDAPEADNMDLPVRMGIHTGPVVFGPVGERLPMDYTAIGDTANVAARLQQAADPATILLSEDTYRLAQSYARVEPVGPLSLRGKAGPISAYRLLEISQARAALRASTAARTTAFINRHADLAILNNILAQVEDGRRQAVGIVGEPGIGKSRLLSEFRRQLDSGRVTWIEGRCVSYGTAIPYLLVLDLLRSNCGIVESDSPEAITEKVRAGLEKAGMEPDQDAPVLLHLLGIKDVVLAPALSNPETVKVRIFETFRQISIKLSLLRPLVLVLEDLHWIDNISEEFLGFLIENILESRILLLATYRPGYRPPWIDKSYAVQVPLQPLSRDDSIDVVQSVLRVEPLIKLITEEIVAKGDGNPFFLEQLTLHAGEARELRSDLMVPNTIHDVVMARIDRLPDEAKRLLQIAAVIGREFSLPLLSAVWKGPEPLETQLRELSRLEFVYERAEPQRSIYVFRHALTQEAAYGSLLERHRRLYHGVVGQALEELYDGRADEVAELLALHFGRSDEADKAVDYAILAAEKSQRRWANNEALTYFSDALRRLEKMPGIASNRLRRIDAVLKQAEVKYALGQYTEHIQALESIRSIVDETSDPPRRAAWHYWTGFLHSTSGGRPDVAIEYCREAAKIASASGLDEINAFAESCLAQVYVVAGRLRDAIDAGERALSSFEACGNRWWAGRTLWQLTSAANYLGEWEKSLNYCRRGLEHGVVLNDLRLQAAGWYRMGTAHIVRGDVETGLQCCNEALALGPIPRDAAWARVVRGYGKIKAGQVDDGIVELSEALAWFESSHMRFSQVIGSVWLAEGHLHRGDRATARRLIDDVLAVSRTTGYLHYEGRACWLMAECLAAEAPASAEDYIETAMRIFERVGARNDLAKAIVTRAALHQSAGDVAMARQLLDQASAIFQRLGTHGELAGVRAGLAALRAGSKNPGSAAKI
jgi:class 3 adenylate cyclase/tetratricopeptide (TPR) repeat protein